MQAVLVIRSCPTSIEFAAYDGTSPGELSVIGKGHVKLVGGEIEFFVKNAVSSHPEIVCNRPADGAFDHDAAIARMLRWTDRHCGLKIMAIGHCAKHDGRGYPASVLVSEGVLDDLEATTAPDQSHFLNAMRFLSERLPSIPQVACFDSSMRGASLQLVSNDARAEDSPVNAVRTDIDKTIAADTLRCTERAPTEAVIHAFPSVAPEPLRESYPPIKLAVAG